MEPSGVARARCCRIEDRGTCQRAHHDMLACADTYCAMWPARLPDSRRRTVLDHPLNLMHDRPCRGSEPRLEHVSQDESDRTGRRSRFGNTSVVNVRDLILNGRHLRSYMHMHMSHAHVHGH
eukprot:6561435-Prymnesium_polylepis.1